MSTLSAFPFLGEQSFATPGAFNSPLSILSANIAAINADIGGFSGVTITPPSGNTITIRSALSITGQVQSGPLHTDGPIRIDANSNLTNYLYLSDVSNLRSDYIIGSQVGGTADGLNIWDDSGQTMIVSFSKQSIRFYQNVVGPVFDVGGALANTLNAATFGTGADSRESRIQAAINAASLAGIARVYVPANMYPYSASSMSFIDSLQMVREGGDWSVYDIRAYGAYGDGLHRSDTSSFQAAVNATPPDGGGEVYVPPGTYLTNVASARANVTLTGAGPGWHEDQGAATILQATSGTILDLGDPTSTNLRGWVIQRLQFRDATSSGGVDYGVRVRRTRHTIFDNVSFVSFTGWNGAAIFLDGQTAGFTEYSEIYSPKIRNCRKGITTFQAGSIRVFGGHFENALSSVTSSIGIELINNSDTVFLYGTAFENWTIGIDASGFTKGSNIVASGMRFEEIPANHTTTGVRLATHDNVVVGGDFINCAVGVSISSGALRNQIVANTTFGVTSIVSDGNVLLNATKVWSEDQATWRTATANIGGVAGFIKDARTGDTGDVPALLVSFNRGMLLKDATTVGGGLFLTSEGIADGTNSRSEIANCAYGDVASDLLSAVTAPCGVQFLNGEMRFYTNSNATAGSAFARSFKLRIDPTGIAKAFFADGGAIAPSLAYSSESSLGYYRSASSTIALSYGTLSAPIVAPSGGGNAVVFTGPTNNRANWGTIGVAAPTFNAYSNGVKVVLYDAVNAGAAGYTIGVDNNTQFYTVPNAAAGQQFQWYGGTTVIGTLAYPGIWLLPAGSAGAPSYAFASESTLGWYRSGVDTIAQSQGTLNLATNAVRLSMRTIAASALTASAANTNVAVNETVFTISASGASWAINSGGTTWIFNSDASAKNT